MRCPGSASGAPASWRIEEEANVPQPIVSPPRRATMHRNDSLLCLRTKIIVVFIRMAPEKPIKQQTAEEKQHDLKNK